MNKNGKAALSRLEAGMTVVYLLRLSEHEDHDMGPETLCNHKRFCSHDAYKIEIDHEDTKVMREGVMLQDSLAKLTTVLPLEKTILQLLARYLYVFTCHKKVVTCSGQQTCVQLLILSKVWLTIRFIWQIYKECYVFICAVSIKIKFSKQLETALEETYKCRNFYVHGLPDSLPQPKSNPNKFWNVYQTNARTKTFSSKRISAWRR